MIEDTFTRATVWLVGIHTCIWSSSFIFCLSKMFY